RHLRRFSVEPAKPDDGGAIAPPSPSIEDSTAWAIAANDPSLGENAGAGGGDFRSLSLEYAVAIPRSTTCRDRPLADEIVAGVPATIASAAQSASCSKPSVGDETSSLFCRVGVPPCCCTVCATSCASKC